MKNLINKLDKLELDKKKIILIIVACAAILYVDFAFILKSQIQSLTTLGPQIKQLRVGIDKLNTDLAEMRDLNAKQTELLAKAKKIISEDQLPLLFKEISDIANKNNVKIMQIKPATEKGAKEEEGKGQGKFIPIMLTLDLSCSYHSLGKFVNALENAAQFMAVQEFKVESEPQNYLRQKADILLMTCVKK